jgi:hypothetical protein
VPYLDRVPVGALSWLVALWFRSRVARGGGGVTMSNSFTNEEYTAMHFVYCFCTGNARAAIVE